MKIKLTSQQAAALEMVKAHKFSILTGSPGTGKTTITHQIVDWAKSQKYNIKLASPSGKAAQVLSQATNHSASTIHRLLRPQVTRKHGRLQFYFEHDADNQLSCDFLIVDEFSMVSNDLAASLFQAIDVEKTRVLLVGDSNQISSVQPGNVLADLIGCGSVPCTELSEVFRHSGNIIKLCQAIRTDDKMYILPEPPTSIINIDKGLNYLHIECSNMEGIHNTIIKLATENMPRRGFYVERGDVQILSPVNEKTVLSCQSLNKAIQDIVNQQPVENIIENKGNGEEFRLGSRVINTKNLYDATSADDGNKQLVLNGDCGYICDLQGSKKQMIVEFSNPVRKILVNKWKHCLKLSYAVTVHRAQGSQFNCVLMPVHSVFKYSFGRALLYTAVSRAKTLLISVGEKKAIRQAIRDVSAYSRQTMLIDKIQEGMLDEL